MGNGTYILINNKIGTIGINNNDTIKCKKKLS